MTVGAEIRKFEPIAHLAADGLPIRFGYFDYDHGVGMALDRGKNNRRAWRFNKRVHIRREHPVARVLERAGILKPRTRQATVEEIKLNILWQIRAIRETEAGQNASWDEAWKP